MAVRLFSEVKKITFSGMDYPSDQRKIAVNTFRASIWGTLGSGGTALVSFIFTRYLIQNEPWKSVAPHVVKATLSSCGTFAAITAYILYKLLTDGRGTDDSLKPLNSRVSLFAKRSAVVGLIGAAAATLATKYVQESSLAKHSLYPLLGLGAAGSILWLFTHRQNKEFELSMRKSL